LPHRLSLCYRSSLCCTVLVAFLWFWTFIAFLCHFSPRFRCSGCVCLAFHMPFTFSVLGSPHWISPAFFAYPSAVLVASLVYSFSRCTAVPFHDVAVCLHGVSRRLHCGSLPGLRLDAFSRLCLRSLPRVLFFRAGLRVPRFHRTHVAPHCAVSVTAVRLFSWIFSPFGCVLLAGFSHTPGLRCALYCVLSWFSRCYGLPALLHVSCGIAFSLVSRFSRSSPSRWICLVYAAASPVCAARTRLLRSVAVCVSVCTDRSRLFTIFSCLRSRCLFLFFLGYVCGCRTRSFCLAWTRVCGCRTFLHGWLRLRSKFCTRTASFFSQFGYVTGSYSSFTRFLPRCTFINTLTSGFYWILVWLHLCPGCLTPTPAHVGSRFARLPAHIRLPRLRCRRSRLRVPVALVLPALDLRLRFPRVTFRARTRSLGSTWFAPFASFLSRSRSAVPRTVCGFSARFLRILLPLTGCRAVTTTVAGFTPGYHAFSQFNAFPYTFRTFGFSFAYVGCAFRLPDPALSRTFTPHIRVAESALVLR